VVVTSVPKRGPSAAGWALIRDRIADRVHWLRRRLGHSLRGASPRSGDATGYGWISGEYSSLGAGADIAPLLKGLEGDLCEAPHWGYLTQGEFTVTYADGTEERRPVLLAARTHREGWCGRRGHPLSPQAEHGMVIDYMRTKMAGRRGPTLRRPTARSRVEAERRHLLSWTASVRPDIDTVDAELRRRVDEGRAMATRNVAQSRQILRKLLAGRIIVTPREDRTCAMSGRSDYGKLFSGVPLATAVASPPGFEPGFWP